LFGDHLQAAAVQGAGRLALVRGDRGHVVEARQFLASDEPSIDVILTLSGRSPLWLATLAEARPDYAADTGDPAGDAVERFSKWEEDAVRHIAVISAIARTLSQDGLDDKGPLSPARGGRSRPLALPIR
jgi:hypothetical protein